MNQQQIDEANNVNNMGDRKRWHEAIKNCRSFNQPIILTPTPIELCARLQAAAIKCDDYHVFVSYAPHVSGLSVYVERADTEYKDSERVIDRLVDETVFMELDGALGRLTDIVDQLQRLGIDV